MGKMVLLVGDVGLVKVGLGIMLLTATLLLIRPRRWPQWLRWLYTGFFSSILVLVTGIVLLAGYEIHTLRTSEQVSYQELFANAAADQLEQKFLAFAEAIQAQRNAYYRSGKTSLEQDQFLRLAKNILKIDSNISLVQWLPWVRYDDLGQIQHTLQRRLHHFKFVLIPASPPLYDIKSHRIINFPAVFSLSREQALNRVLGYDHANDPWIRDYLQRDLHSPRRDRVFFSGRIHGTADTGPYVLYLPIFRPDHMASLQGFIAVTFSIQPFIDQSLQRGGYEQLLIEIIDQSFRKFDLPERTLYTHLADELIMNDYKPYFVGRTVLQQDLDITIWLPKHLERLYDEIRAANHND